MEWIFYNAANFEKINANCGDLILYIDMDLIQCNQDNIHKPNNNKSIWDDAYNLYLKLDSSNPVSQNRHLMAPNVIVT